MQGSRAVSRNPITDRDRYGDHQAGNEAANHAWKGTIHPRNHDHDREGPDLFDPLEQAPEPGNADVACQDACLTIKRKGPHGFQYNRRVGGPAERTAIRGRAEGGLTGPKNAVRDTGS